MINDVLHTFGWSRQPDPQDYYGNGPNFRFVSAHEMNLQIPWYVTPAHIPGNPIYQLHSTTARPGAMRAARRTTARRS